MPTIIYDNPVYQPGEEVHFTEFNIVAENGKPFDAPKDLADALKDHPHVTFPSAKAKDTGGDK